MWNPERPLMKRLQARARIFNPDWPVAALLIRKGKIVQRGYAHIRKTHPLAQRTVNYGTEEITIASIHAETDLIKYIKPGDSICVIRWKKDGSFGCSHPCHHCLRKLIDLQLDKIIFYSEDDDWRALDMTSLSHSHIDEWRQVYTQRNRTFLPTPPHQNLISCLA